MFPPYTARLSSGFWNTMSPRSEMTVKAFWLGYSPRTLVAFDKLSVMVQPVVPPTGEPGVLPSRSGAQR